MFSKFLKGVIPAFAGVLALECLHYFRAHNIAPAAAVLLAGVLSFFTVRICELVVDSARKKSRFIRKILDERARFEGDWFVQAEPGSRMPYGAVSITYNPDGDVFLYDGQAYTSEGKVGSHWFCENLQFDIPFQRIRFVCQTWIKGEVGTIHEAYGWIIFKRSPLRRRLRYAWGEGCFTVTDNQMKGQFSVERLDPKMIEKVLGAPFISNKEEMTKVVCHYHGQKPSLAESTSPPTAITAELPDPA